MLYLKPMTKKIDGMSGADQGPGSESLVPKEKPVLNEGVDAHNRAKIAEVATRQKEHVADRQFVSQALKDLQDADHEMSNARSLTAYEALFGQWKKGNLTKSDLKIIHAIEQARSSDAKIIVPDTLKRINAMKPLFEAVFEHGSGDAKRHDTAAVTAKAPMTSKDRTVPSPTTAQKPVPTFFDNVLDLVGLKRKK